MSARNPKFEGKKKGTPSKTRGARKTAPKALRLEVGKKYMNGHKEVRGPLEKTPSRSGLYRTHPLRDPRTGETFRLTGHYLNLKNPTGADLIREVKAPNAKRPEAKPRGKKPKALGTDNDRIVRARK